MLIWERNLGGPPAGAASATPDVRRELQRRLAPCPPGRGMHCAMLAPQWPGALNASEILIERRLAGPPPGCCPWAIAAAHWHSTPGIIAATARRGVLRLPRRPAARRPNGHPHPSAGAVRGQRLSALQVATARNGSKCSALQVCDTQRAIKAPLAGVLGTNREVPAQLRENSSNTEPPSAALPRETLL